MMVGVSRVIGFVFFLMFLLQAATTCQAAETPATWTVRLDAQTETVLANIGRSCCRQIQSLVDALGKQKNLRLAVESSFYDPKLRRVFVAFNGSGAYAGEFPGTPSPTGYFLTSDGSLAYDLTVQDVVAKGEAITFRFRGTLVIFEERVILDLASRMTGMSGIPGFREAASTLLLVVDGIDCQVVAQGIDDLMASFSPKRLAEMGRNILAKVKSSEGLSGEVKAAVKSGKALDYLRLSVVNLSLAKVAGAAGASLGALVGSVVVPGPVGAVGGLFVGKHLAVSLARTTIYKLTVDVPIAFGLRKIRQAWTDLQSPQPGASAKVTLGMGLEMVLTPIRKEFDRSQFQAFDLTLDNVGQETPRARRTFLPLLKELQKEILRRVTVEADWYFAKKYYQFKAKVGEWGLLDELPFTANPPAEGKPSRQPASDL